MASRFQAAYGERLAERKAAGEIGDVDPMLAVMVATRWLFDFFTVEKCFGVPMHLGMTPRQMVRGFIRLLRLGLEPRPGDGPPAAPGLQSSPPSPQGALQSFEIDTLIVRTLEVERLHVRNPPDEDET